MTRPISRTILVTGATSSLGYETARLLANAAEATVIIHGRTAASALSARMRLIRHGASPGRIEAIAADFTRLSEVAAMARLVKARHRYVDVLVHNADVAAPNARRVTEDGNEVTFQANYLAPYLLTRLLLARIMSSPGGRMVAVSTSLHRIANIDWADPQRRKTYSSVAAYAQSKLALVMFARSLAVLEPQIDTASVDPWSTEPSLRSVLGGRQPAIGDASAVARLCTGEVALSSGGYYEQFSIGTASPLVDNHSALGRLWQLSASLVGLDHAYALA
jgi:NAD(P)-dependent dehydrogenase (short-subunit alcohol dehydrogenase family)